MDENDQTFSELMEKILIHLLEFWVELAISTQKPMQSQLLTQGNKNAV